VFDAEPEFDLLPLQALPQVKEVMRSGCQAIVSGHTDGLLAAVVARLEEERIPFRNLRTEQADLEDVFLRLTGRAIRDA
jgi:ABC-2 type transport system ATP-binding protein